MDGNDHSGREQVLAYGLWMAGESMLWGGAGCLVVGLTRVPATAWFMATAALLSAGIVAQVIAGKQARVGGPPDRRWRSATSAVRLFGAAVCLLVTSPVSGMLALGVASGGLMLCRRLGLRYVATMREEAALGRKRERALIGLFEGFDLVRRGQGWERARHEHLNAAEHEEEIITRRLSIALRFDLCRNLCGIAPVGVAAAPTLTHGSAQLPSALVTYGLAFIVARTARSYAGRYLQPQS